MCLYVLYKTYAGVNIDPMGQTFKKNHLDEGCYIKLQKHTIGAPRAVHIYILLPHLALSVVKLITLIKVITSRRYHFSPANINFSENIRKV